MSVSGEGTFEVIGGSIKQNGGGVAVWVTGANAINVTGGTISAAAGRAIYAHNSEYLASAVTVSGGTVSATSGNAIYASICNIVVSGGTVSAATGHAIYVYGSTTIVVSGTGKVAATGDKGGAINTGGNVEVKDNAEVSATTGTAIGADGSRSVVTVSGGTISTATGRAISNSGDSIIVGGTSKVMATGDKGHAIYGGTGHSAVIIKDDAEISATTGYTVYNDYSFGKIIVSGGTVSTVTGHAIYNRGDTTIVGGNSKVMVTGDRGYAIYNYIVSDVIIIEDNAEVTATAGYAVYAYDGDVIVNGGTVSATTGYAIYADDNVRVNDGTVSATTGYAIYTDDGNITVNGGTVSATTGYALYANSSTRYVIINDGVVSATEGHAVRAYGEVTVSGGIVSAVTGNAVIASRNVTVSGTSKIIVTDGDKDNYTISAGGRVKIQDDAEIAATAGYAIRSSNDVTVDGGTVSATAGYAISASGTATDVTVNGGTISATSGYAITVSGTASGVTVNGGTVSATTGYAISVSGSLADVTVSGGKVIAATGYAIDNSQKNDVRIKGGLVFAYGNDIIGTNNVVAYGGNNFSKQNDGIAIAWDSAAGNSAYTAGTSDDIAFAYASYLDQSANAVWAVESGKHGIKYFCGDNTGFIELPVTVTGETSIHSPDRTIPTIPSKDGAVIVPTIPASLEITAGPNPIQRSVGIIKIFTQGNPLVSGDLTIYDATGNIVRKINVKDNGDVRDDNDKRVNRVIGVWDLKDAKDRAVSAGTYLVRGTVKTVDGKRERVSVVVSVR